MNITITGRHVNVSDRLQDYAKKKISKLEKFFNQLIDARIILYVEKLDHAAEVIINGDGVQFYGREKAGNHYSAIDLLFEKMEKQVTRYKEKHSAHKGPQKESFIPFDVSDEHGKEVRLNQVSNKPIDKIEAYLQMKNDNKDFILFKIGIPEVDSTVDLSNKSYAVIHNSNGELKMVKIPFEKIKEQNFDYNTFIQYNLNVIDDSAANPNIEFDKDEKCSVKTLTLVEAIDEIESTEGTFLPFFNIESQYFNVIQKQGNDYEIMVPAF